MQVVFHVHVFMQKDEISGTLHCEPVRILRRARLCSTGAAGGLGIEKSSEPVAEHALKQKLSILSPEPVAGCIRTKRP